MTPEHQRYVTCLHEAGHAVLAMRLGKPMSITMRRQGRVTRVYASPHIVAEIYDGIGGATRHSCLHLGRIDMAAMAWAGGTAVAELCLPSTCDYLGVWDLVSGPDRADFMAQGLTPRAQTRAMNLARKMVLQRHTEILRLAAQIYRHGAVAICWTDDHWDVSPVSRMDARPSEAWLKRVSPYMDDSPTTSPIALP